MIIPAALHITPLEMRQTANRIVLMMHNCLAGAV